MTTTPAKLTSYIDFEAYAGNPSVLAESIGAAKHQTALYFADKANDLKQYKLDQLSALASLQLGEDLKENASQAIAFLVKDLANQISALNQVHTSSLDTVASKGGAA